MTPERTQIAVKACIALGSNLGDREQSIRRAALALSGLAGTRVAAFSTLHETAPVGGVAQGPYLNAAALVETCLDPWELLGGMLRIERELGRDRAKERRWGPRTVDLDLILYGDRVIEHAELTVPHPRMQERLFVLAPLVEVAPDLVHPVLRRSVRRLYENLSNSATRGENQR